MSDYQIVNWQGQVVRDTAVERERREELKSRRNGEPFTASTDCPDCGHLGVHWLTEPRLEPEGNSPVEKVQRSMAMLNLFGSAPFFDPPGCSVARVCVKCGYRWGQS